jgi:CRP/FNR family transcriptional regulator
VHRHSITRTHAAGDVVVRESDSALGVTCVRAGYGVARTLSETAPVECARVVGAGFQLGIVELFTAPRIHVELRALGPMRTCFVPRASLEGALARSTELARGLMTSLADTVTDIRGQLGVDCVRSADARVLAVILDLRHGFGTPTPDGGVHVQMPVSRRQLAELARVTPETLSRVIAALSKRGICVFEGRDATIADVDEALDFVLGEV